MQYRTLGRTGLRVSAVGFGCAPMGLAHYLAPEDTADAAVQARFADAVCHAVDRGITYLDTAPGYGDGLSETVLGRVLPGLRDRVVLASKCPWNAGADAVEESVTASLRRLHTDHVDLMQFHGGWYSDADARRLLDEGCLDRLERLRAAGAVRFVGITAEVPSGALERLLATGRFDVLQVGYSLISQLSCDHTRPCRGVAALARQQQMGVCSMRTATSGFLQRLLAREFGDQATPQRVTRMCLQFVLSTPEIDVALLGLRNRAEVDAAVAVADDLAGRYDPEDLHNRFRDRPT